MRASIATLALLVTVAVHFQTATSQDIEGLFYLVDSYESFESFRENVKDISIVGPTAYSVDADGVVWGAVDKRVIELAKENGVGVMPLIKNPGFDQEMLTKLLRSDTARARAIESILDECRRYDYVGFQFDFENININDADAYSRFFQETASALHAEGYLISMAVVHRPDKFPGPNQYFKWLFSNWRAAYDLEALGKVADFISIMTYSQHTRRTPPGPNAGIPWVEKNIDFFLQHVPAEKLSLGIPVITQHWRIEHDDERYVANARSWSRTLRHPETQSILERYDAQPIWLEEQGVSYTFFDNGGLFEWLFIEDARSFERKLQLVEEHGLRGFSVWVLGHEDPAIWDHIEPVGRR